MCRHSAFLKTTKIIIDMIWFFYICQSSCLFIYLSTCLHVYLSTCLRKTFLPSFLLAGGLRVAQLVRIDLKIKFKFMKIFRKCIKLIAFNLTLIFEEIAHEENKPLWSSRLLFCCKICAVSTTSSSTLCGPVQVNCRLVSLYWSGLCNTWSYVKLIHAQWTTPENMRG